MNVDIQQIKHRFGIIGTSPLLDHAIRTAVQVAPTDMSVLVIGESGVGKESFPKIIHQNSIRKHGPYIAVNCGAIPEGTIDSALFGHLKGSFTGAITDRKGYFQEASGGTIFLDEVGELPLSTQARFPRVPPGGGLSPPAGQASPALKGRGAGAPGFEAIAKNFSGTDAANLAHAYSGICLYDQGKYQEALAELKKFSADETVVAPSVQRMIGDCLAQLGKLEEAVKTYEAAAKAASSEAISPSCLIKAGHVYEKLGKYDKAIALYNEVKTKYYNARQDFFSSEYDNARRRLVQAYDGQMREF